MKSCLIGSSGFIGANLRRQYMFDDHFTSKNIEQIRGQFYDLVVCAGISASKEKACRSPAEDRAAIEALLGHLAQVQADRFVLISTSEVYPVQIDWDEAFDPAGTLNHPFGINRLHAEHRIRNMFRTLHVIRLPAMFGPDLKRNLIHDLLHGSNLDTVHPNSRFQYYDVRRLWVDMVRTIANDLPLVNFATEPIQIGRVVGQYFPSATSSLRAQGPAPYTDLRTLFASEFGGPEGYIYSAAQVLADLGDWISTARTV